MCSFFLLVVTRPADSNRAADVTWIYEEQKNGIMEEVFKSGSLHVFVFIVVFTASAVYLNIVTIWLKWIH